MAMPRAKALLLVAAAPCLLGLASGEPLMNMMSAKDVAANTQDSSLKNMMGNMQLEAPQLSEEEERSKVMPDRFRCDACKAVMFQLDQALRVKQPKSRRLKDYEYTDIFDEACDMENFKGYGITKVMGVNELSGPGIKKEDPLTKAIGHMQLNSETWSKRLGQTCRNNVYEKLGEDETYEHFYRRFAAEQKAGSGEAVTEDGLSEALCIKELRQCGTEQEAGQGKPAGKEKKSKGAKKTKSSKKTEQAKGSQKKAKDDHADVAKDAAAGEPIELETFMQRFAAKTGAKAEDYTAPRTEAEWEQQILAMASGIFSRQQHYM